MKLLSDPFSNLSGPLWVVAWPSDISAAPTGFVLSTNLLLVRSTTSSRLLMKISNKTEPSIVRWGTWIDNGLKLDFALLITTLYMHPLHIFIYSLFLRISQEAVLKALLTSRYQYPLFSPRLLGQSLHHKLSWSSMKLRALFAVDALLQKWCMG